MSFGRLPREPCPCLPSPREGERVVRGASTDVAAISQLLPAYFNLATLLMTVCEVGEEGEAELGQAG